MATTVFVRTAGLVAFLIAGAGALAQDVPPTCDEGLALLGAGRYRDSAAATGRCIDSGALTGENLAIAFKGCISAKIRFLRDYYDNFNCLHN